MLRTETVLIGSKMKYFYQFFGIFLPGKHFQALSPLFYQCFSKARIFNYPPDLVADVMAVKGVEAQYGITADFRQAGIAGHQYRQLVMKCLQHREAEAFVE